MSIAGILIEELKKLCIEKACKQPMQSQDELLCRMILNQFRFLENIVDGFAFSTSLLGIVPVAPGWVQQEIFAFLPELLSDDRYEGVALLLRDIMQENEHLITPVLRSLNNMTFSEELTLQVKEIVFKSLNSSAPEAIPMKLKFLLQCRSPSEAVEVVERLREELKLYPPSFSDRKFAESEKQDMSVLEIFKVIDSAIKYRQYIGDAVCKVLDRVKNGVQPIEFEVLSFFYANFRDGTN
ncbi:unnamed protein product [Soboliphyme baturini]|uniref:Fanconi anemia group I protein n=1 Tax=Soboliphyme baturini TaxID=241478 RepID=A0A183J3Y8_9BILA|nr:unnamed protein product [Soboliphyme baturini]